MAQLISIPKPTLERLPRYLRVLHHQKEKGNTFISSGVLGHEIGVDEFQVRKDLQHVKISGRPGKGYFIDDLIDSIEELLGLNNVNEAIVIGAGRLGQAISLYSGFDRYGLRIVALFDHDPIKIGHKIGEKPILNVAKMPDLIRRMAIPMAVITVPAEHAQSVAEQAILGGVRAIWNFAPVVLEVPAGVHVRNEDLAVGLASLSHHLAKASKRKTKI
ncbi:MAG: redox-sensing transcriptional repressor Rex [Limnochordia bacterium]|jgi:redox-sensing transcriptional repressor|nr:redox-sensing transcriptional repressor Rex [Limnochordia bacterium]MDD2629356.1 redox-sensing transcriptional repressor Rex [Limnochordia bacterium]MDD4518231.1 redox-sensing transcriptional repressor Rex [Limnochordia bacterium]